MTEIIIAIAVWCGQPYFGNALNYMTKESINSCRDRLLVCYEAEKKVNKEPILECVKREPLK